MLSNRFKKIAFSPDILKRIKFSWGLHFLFQLGWIIAWVVVTALFVEKFGFKNLLYLFSIEAALLLTGTLLTHRFCKRISNKIIINGSAGAIIILLLGSFFISQTHPQNPYLLFGLALVAKDIFYPRLRMGLLRKTEELFTPKQAESAIPITESALTIGTVGGASFLLLMIRFFPEATTQSLFAWWLFPLLLILLLLTLEPLLLAELPVLHINKEEQRYESYDSTFKNVYKLFQKTPFLRSLAIVVALQASLFAMIEFETVSHLEHELHRPVTTTEIAIDPSYLSASLFNDVKEVSQKFIEITNEEIHVFSSKVIAHNTLLHDLSALNLFFGVIALFIHFFLSPLLLRKKGIVRTMLLYFVGLLCTIPALLLGGSWSIAAVRSYEHGFHSLFSAGYHMSFYSTFARQREFLRHFLEGILAPMGVLLGVGIVFLLHRFEINMFFPVALSLLIVTIILITRAMIPQYTDLAIKNLNQTDSLHEMMHAIEILGQEGHTPKATIKALFDLLKDSKAHLFLREKIILTLPKMHFSYIIPEFSKILENDKENDELKIKILETMLEYESLKSFWEENMFSQYRLLETLKKLFQTTNHGHLQKLIVMNIFAHLPADQVVPFFLETMESADEKIKAVCLRSCAMFNDSEFITYAESYLQHENARIRSHALIALWNFLEQEELRPHLESFFLSGDHESIIAGLYAAGELKDYDSYNFILPFTNHEDLELKIHALIALAKLKDCNSFRPLMEMLFSPDEVAAQKVFGMLKRVPSDIREDLYAHMQQEIAHKVWNIIGYHPHPETIHTLSKDKKSYLRRLYLFANRHDDLLVLEGAN